jgi:hypothetical protein
MVLSSIETLPVQGVLAAVLWITAIIYTGIGLYEMFDDFTANPKWNKSVYTKENCFHRMEVKANNKMHASIALVLGLVAVNALAEGKVGRLELELEFLSLACLFGGAIVPAIIPFRMWAVVLLIKPETWLTVMMWSSFCSDVRPVVLGISGVIMAWGFVVRFGPKSAAHPDPFTYETIRKDLLLNFSETDGAKMAKSMDFLAGYKATTKSPLASMENGMEETVENA